MEKRHGGPLGEHSLTEKRSTRPLVSPGLDAGETQGSSKSRRQTEQRDGHRRGSRSSRIASQALSPGEAKVGHAGRGRGAKALLGENSVVVAELAHRPVDCTRAASTPVGSRSDSNPARASGRFPWPEWSPQPGVLVRQVDGEWH